MILHKDVDQDLERVDVEYLESCEWRGKSASDDFHELPLTGARFPNTRITEVRVFGKRAPVSSTSPSVISRLGLEVCL